MGIRELYDFQRLEQDIAAGEQALAKAQAQVGESPALKQAKDSLAQAESEFAAVRSEQKTTEYALADITAKMAVANESLYSGRIKNPKELQNLQRELASLQTQRDPLEEKSLTLMEKAEQAEGRVRHRRDELTAADSKWEAEQAALLQKIQTGEKMLRALKLKRTDAIAKIPASEMALYSQLRKTHIWAVARLEQGSCGHCRLTQSTAVVQRARGGHLANCSSCRRLLFYE